MGFKRYKWQKVAGEEAEIQWSPGGIGVIALEDGKKICIAKEEGAFYGFAYHCPHAGGVMAEGWLDGEGNVVCPIHHYRFSLKQGRNTSGEGYHLKRYPIESRADGIYVGIEEGGLFRWF